MPSGVMLSAPFFASEAHGVSQNEHPGSCVWGAHCTSRDRSHAYPVSESAEVSNNVVDAEGEQTGHILADDPFGTEVSDDLGHGRPQPPIVLLRALKTCLADRLTRESPCDNIDGRSNSASPPLDSGSDIVMPRHLRPVFGQHPPAELVDFHLADDGHARALQAQLEAADPAEEGQHIHPPNPRSVRAAFFHLLWFAR
jgi:hypothetical protein